MVVTTPLGAQDDTVETWDASRPRRSVRQFTEQPLPDEMLDRLLKAGRCAPLGGQLAAARLRARHEHGRSCSDWRRPGKGAKHVAGAAAAIAVAAPEPQDDLHFLLQYDLGQATYAMTVAAADLGVGAGHAAAAPGPGRAVLGFTEGRFRAYILSVGYPSDKPLADVERLNRRPFDEVVQR